MLGNPQAVRKLTFKGGEPFASKETVDILDYLSSEGDARKTEIGVVTNGTIADAKLLNITARFKHFSIAVSLDGVNNLFEYIRYPAKWKTVEENLRRFSKLSNVTLTTSITFQAYNAIQIVELFRFCDQFDYRINVNDLVYPAFLAASVLPPKARKVAARRIRDYTGTDCRQKYRAKIEALATGIEAIGNRIDMHNLQKFMQFTNDLDQGRNQHFREVHAELLGYMEEDGISWNDAPRFARLDSTIGVRS